MTKLKTPIIEKAKATARTTDATTISWTAYAKAPGQRWYWWVIFFWIVIPVAATAFLLENYAFFALIVVMAVTLVLLYTQASDKLSYRLEGKKLTVGKNQTISLTDYRNSYMEKAWESHNKDYKSANSIVLLPTKGLKPAFTIVLPEDQAKSKKILSLVTKHVPLTTDSNYQANMRILDRFLKWIKLQ